MRRIGRLVAVLALLAALSTMPVRQVAACDCEPAQLPDAVRQADVAFVGTLAERERGGDNFGVPVTDRWRWSVERSRDAGIGPQLVVEAEPADGANCGVVFSVGERWLVIASVHDGALRAHGCQPHHRFDGSDPEREADIADLVSDVVAPGGASTAGWEVPSPVLVSVGVVVLIGVGAWAAFRREGRPTS